MTKGRKKEFVNENICKVVLTSNNKEYVGTGKSVYEALSNIPLFFMDLKNKANIKITFGDKSVEKLLLMQQARRLLHNPIRRSGWAKQFEALLK